MMMMMMMMMMTAMMTAIMTMIENTHHHLYNYSLPVPKRKKCNPQTSLMVQDGEVYSNVMCGTVAGGGGVVRCS
jgi:hypothetical protein